MPAEEPRLPTLLRPAMAWCAVIALAVLAILASGRWAQQREQSAQAAALRHAVEVHALGLRGAAERFEYLPYTVAQQPQLLALLASPRDPARIEAANHYLEDVNRRAGASALYVMDPSGLTLAASNWRTADTFVGQTYRRRPYFQDAIAGRVGFFYGIGVTTGVPGLFIASPIRRGEEVVGAIAVKVGLEALESTLGRSPDPVIVTDTRGIAFLSSVPDWTYRVVAPMSAADRAWVAEHAQYGERREFDVLPWRVRRTDGQAEYRVDTSEGGRPVSYVALDEAIPSLGWTLTVMAGRASVVRARNEAMALAALAMGVLLLAAMYWQLRERRLTEQRSARLELERTVADRTRELREEHALRKAMEDSLLVGMRARDLDGRIIYVNPALCEITGYSAHELLGRQPPYPYWHPDDMEKHWRDNEAALSGRAALTGFESRIRHRDGHDVITMVYTAPLIDSTGRHTGWMSSVVDVTAQRQAEERHRQQQSQWQRAARLVSLGEMASSLAHELNQPLMALTSFASAARELARQGQTSMVVESLEDIDRQAQRAAEIVRRIRGFVRRRPDAFEDCEARAIVAAVVAAMESELRQRRVRLGTEVEDGLVVRGDRVLLELVLSNLLLNGLQAMADTPADQRALEVRVHKDAQGLACFEVSDAGTGVPENAAAHLFELMFTTKSDGLGLGLNICHTIIEGHGGHIGFRNRSPRGAVFHFTLPTRA